MGILAFEKGTQEIWLAEWKYFDLIVSGCLYQIGLLHLSVSGALGSDEFIKDEN
jgi:hypothetical protein